MSRKASDDELQDNAPTHELPVLLDTVVLDPAKYAVGPPDDDGTGDQPVLYHVASLADEPAEPALSADAQLDALRDDLARLAARAAEVEQSSTEKSTVIGRLKAELGEANRKLEEAGRAAKAAVAAARDRDAQLGAMTPELEHLRAVVASREGQDPRLTEGGVSAPPDLPPALSSPAEPAGTAAEDVPESATQRMREELAALAGYIANRRARWDDLQARLEEYRRRIAELEQEVEQRTAREHRAEQIAANERARAAELEAAAIEAARATRKTDGDADVGAAARRKSRLPAVPSDPLGAAKVESKVDALRRHVAEANEALATSLADLEQERAYRAELEIAIDARDRRIDALERALDEGSEVPQSFDIGPARSHRGRAEHGRPGVGPVESPQAPALVCLTSDVPQTHTLGKATITIGRSSHCDIQIITQFVSREHACLTVSSSEVLIEDLGSTNGVFVNSVRIERQHLSHGDLVTVGETQFRFVGRLAHRGH